MSNRKAHNPLYKIMLFVLAFSTFYSPFLLPDGVTAFLDVVSMAILVSYVIVIWKRLDIFDLLCVAFLAYIIAITLTMHHLSMGILVTFTNLSFFTIFLKHQLIKNTLLTLSAFYWMSALIILLNFISMISPATGSNGESVFLLGGKNALAMVLIPSVFFVYFYRIYRGGKIILRENIIILIALISIFFGGSSTGIIVALLCLIYFFFGKIIKISRILYVSLYAFATLLLLFSHILYNSPTFNAIVHDQLGKNATFSGRADVWDVSLGAASHSFLGYGLANTVVSSQIKDLTESHNMVVELLVTGGPLLLIIFVSIVLLAIGKKPSNKYQSLYYLCAFFIFTYLVIGLTESVPFKIYLWSMLAFVRTLPILESQSSA